MPKTILLFFLSSLLFFRFISFYQAQPTYKAGDEVSFQTTLHEEPDFSNKGQQFSIKTPINQIIFVKAQVIPRLHYGQSLIVSGKLQEKLIGKEKSNCQQRCRTLLILHYPEISVRNDSGGAFSQAALFVRKKSQTLFESALPPTSASLLLGIVFGVKEHFLPAFKQNLSTTGVMHVIAASGMNVTFVAAALVSLFSYFFKRQMTLLLAVAGIIFYVFLVGFEPSIVRAAIMAIFAFGAGILGRQNLAIFSLILAGYGMLLWKPAFLFDIGFQLSFLSTLGILLLDKPLGKLGKLAKLSNLTTTLAAQIATLPVMFGVFGGFGILSLLVNVLVLWTVPLLMTLGSFAVIAGFVFEPLAKFFLYLTLPFLLFFEATVSFFGGLGWNFKVESFPWQLTVGYYLVLASLLYFRHSVKKKEVLNP